MKNIIGISSSSSLSISIKKEEIIKSRVYPKSSHSICENLINGIHELLEEVSLSIKDIHIIGVDKGPGSFTGIRIGIATANGLGLSLLKPVIGISSLSIIAEELLFKNQISENFFVSIPAGREQYYYAEFKKTNTELEKIKEDALIHENDLKILADKNCVFGIVKDDKIEKLFPNSEYLIKIIEKLKIEEKEHIFASPNYVRLSDAEIHLKKEKNK